MSNGSVTATPEVVDRSAHEEAMIAKAEGSQISSSDPSITPEAPAAPAAAQRPEHIPEKFWDAATGSVRQDALLEAYKTLEASRGKPAEAPKADPAAAAETDPATEAEQSAVAAAAAEFEEKGELSEDTFVKLEAAGIDRGTAQAYISGIQAIQQLAYVSAGGEEAYGEMIQWAGTHLTPAEAAAYDAAVADSNPRVIAEAVQALAARYRAGARSEPTLVSGKAPGQSAEGFRSRAEMTAAMSDPRYKTDSAFRADVAAKLAAAERAGIQLFI